MSLHWCTNCLNMSTRPRITFDERGWCNACQWMEQKRSMDWSARHDELMSLLEANRSLEGRFDCLVPVSGGKDGSYVSYQLKHKYGMHPLAVTVTPSLEISLGRENLQRFIAAGYDHVQISANQEAQRILNKYGFIEKGFPYYGWLMAMQAAVVNLACQLNIPLIFYGEDGEVEYGGSTATKERASYSVEYMKEIYLEGGYEKVLQKSGLPEGDLNFWRFPNAKQLAEQKINICHWSYFEDWDPYRNYLVAKEHCGLKESDATNSGTFTNFAQNDQALYALHTYMMYLKFGFGRATQDAGIEIRRGAMDRDQAINLVSLYDNQYPEAYIGEYLAHYQMTQEQFDANLAKWVNKDLFDFDGSRWQPTFQIQ